MTLKKKHRGNLICNMLVFSPSLMISKGLDMSVAEPRTFQKRRSPFQEINASQIITGMRDRFSFLKFH